MPFPLYDAHAHLNDEQFAGDLDEVIQRAVDAGVSRIVNVGYDEQSSARALEQASRYRGVYATVGLHPHDAAKLTPRSMSFFDGLASDSKVVAIGETGLDYHYLHSPKEKQLEVLDMHLDLAKALKLPAVIHCRKAYPDLAGVLRKHYHPSHNSWLVHCFSGDMEDLEALIQLDCYFSVGGSITFKNFSKAEIVRRIPADRLLLETDCPYLAPVPRRGKRNEPAWLVFTSMALSNIIDVELERISTITCGNFERLFGVGVV